MASAVLANRNEPNWTRPQPRGGAKFMGKVPFSNANPNPKFSVKRQFQAPAVLDIDESPGLTQSAASDDASSINRRPNDFKSSGYVTFNIASYSKKELAELKNRLVVELEQIRQLKNRIESSDFQIRSGSNYHNKKPVGAPNKKKISGNKRPFPAVATSKDVKRVNNNHSHSTLDPDRPQLMKSCSQILTKLMKHKFGYIFNLPVDVVGLELHDYYDVIKNPMDLGTVKYKLVKNLYDSPRDFAADVRLTFNNAMKYNPKGHDVYVLAEQYLSRFEELYQPIKLKVGEDEDDGPGPGQGQGLGQGQGQGQAQVREVQDSSWDHNHNHPEIDGERDSVNKNEENLVQVMPAKSDQMGNSIPPTGSNQNTSSQLPVRTPSPMRAPPVKPLKQPKPKAKDPNKREMSLEEKHKLGVGLQSLPQEKMEQVVQIIRKRNGHLRQEGDEIELDIEAVDTETLWELDRFVTNYKKMVSKIKRQALMGINNVTTATNEGNKDVPGNERIEGLTEAKKPKKGEVGEEDVDIGDEMPMSSFPPVEIEKDNGRASSSSGSSSCSSDDSSSSSADSESGSSSGSDSEDAHS